MERTNYYPTQPLVAEWPKRTFKYFIACEDQAALDRANKFHDQLRSLCGEEEEIVRMVWNFAFLRHDQLRQFATTEASETNLIIISMRTSSELPPHVKLWMEGLPVRPENEHSALVALLGAPTHSPTHRGELIAYLQQAAQNHGLEFYCNPKDWNRQAFATSGHQPAEPALAVSPLRNVAWQDDGPCELIQLSKQA